MLRAAFYHYPPVVQEFTEERFKRERLRNAVHERKHIEMKGGFQIRVFIEKIENDLIVCVAF